MHNGVCLGSFLHCALYLINDYIKGVDSQPCWPDIPSKPSAESHLVAASFVQICMRYYYTGLMTTAHNGQNFGSIHPRIYASSSDGQWKEF